MGAVRAERFIPQAREKAVSFGESVIWYNSGPVITEVSCLLDFSVEAQADFLTWTVGGALRLEELKLLDFARIVRLMRKYADRPMGLADGSLVALAERMQIREIASVDRDFEIYRIGGQAKFRNVFPN